ncbi:beta-ketoacyl synthase N-terminal-like domain-containing protein [Micromonospora sp. NPDC049275]|uniref:beta-ketoacyl synthase N-terminal-like domain-containing protein n=1 Tax=Micromonospora sp. NPDC049275 TaxID=3364268 RepID=UPI0037156965
MTKIFLFPGHGSHRVGMGGDLFARHPDLVRQADEVLGYSIEQLCLEGPSERLSDNRFTQPAMYVVDALTHLEEVDRQGGPDVVAGHSLGECVALFAAGVFDFRTGLQIVKERARLMADSNSGALITVAGLPVQRIAELLRRSGHDGVEFSAFNSPEQVGLAGPKEELRAVARLLGEEAPAVFWVSLTTAPHSTHMAAAAAEFAELLSGYEFAEPVIPVLSNVTAAPHRPGEIPAMLARQLASPVRWTDTVRYLRSLPAPEFHEVGPGGVLTGLLKANPAAAPAPGPKTVADRSDEPIAIVGVSGRFGGAPSLNDLWDLLVQGRSAIREIPPDRWDHEPLYHAGDFEPGKTHSRWAGLMDGVDRFDALFFGIAPREAETMDPQQRHFLEVTYEALQDAGHTRESLGHNVGVYVAATACDYAVLSAQASMAGVDAYANNNISQLALRVSHFFDLHGPNMTVDAACAGSLVALHLACEALRHGTVDAAIAGAANLILHPWRLVQYTSMGTLSATGACRPFGDGADGIALGEGVAAVVLKRLSQARADGDHVHAVIRGSWTNSDGRSVGFAVPESDRHSELFLRTLDIAGVSARSIGYVEAHGAGTPVGDPVEIRGLTKAYGAHGVEPGSVMVGSVKSNLGHLEPAAGMAGLIKVLLQLRHRTIVPSLHADRANPKIDFDSTPFRVPTSPTPWLPKTDEDGRELPRRAGVNAFGAGGVNAHVVLEEYPAEAPRDEPVDDPELIILSARSRQALANSAARLRAALAGGGLRLRDVAHTLRAGREAFGVRAAVAVQTIEELDEVLAELASPRAEPRPELVVGNARNGAAGGVGGVPGQRPTNVAGLLELGRKWCRGADVPWEKLFADAPGRRIPLPSYPFESERYWLPQPTVAAFVPSSTTETPDESKWLRDRLRAIIAEMLKARPDQVIDDVPFSEHGFDSVWLARLVTRLNREFDLTLAVTAVLEYPTVETLAQHLLDSHAEILFQAPK